MVSQFKQQGDSIDRYEILSILGAGGMGVVYKAHDPSLNKTVAIKLIKGDCASGQLHIRFQREAKALRDLKHPAIPEIYDFAITGDGEPFMVIDYIEGKSLAEYLKEKGQLSIKEAFKIIEPLTTALKYAHDHGIIHRDLKPDNIILVFEKESEDEDLYFGKRKEHNFEGNLDKNSDSNSIPQVKVIDFGLARLERDISESQSLTGSGNILGSPKYMSPEQARGQAASQASDIYSTGCILFEMLATRPPFIGQSALETISLHITRSFEDCLNYLPDRFQTGPVFDLLSSCLAKDPEDRLQNADEIAIALNNYIRAMDESKVKALIEVPEFEQAKQPYLKAFSIFLCALGSISIIGYVSFLGYKYLTKRIAGVKTEAVKAKISEGEEIRDIVEKTGFQHNPNKGYGYYNGAANIDDSDFAGLQQKQPPAQNVASGKSDTVTGDGIKYLKGLPVGRLDLVSAKLSNVAFKNCLLLPKLYDLTISGTALIDQEGLEYLKGIPELRILNMEGCKLKPGMIDKLSELEELYSLSLAGSMSLSEDDLLKLSKLKNLHGLAIDGTNLPAPALKYLKRFNKLRSFKGEDLKITDQQMPYLAELPLESLDISHNQISDRGLILLARNKHLKTLDVQMQFGEKDRVTPLITESGARALMNAIPGLKMRWQELGRDPCK